MATIKDVAALSGVSVTTVSRVLNKRGYISEDTYKKVYDAMAELNYQPNQLARSLSKQKTNFIGLLVPDVSHPFFAEMTHLLEISLFNHGYKLILCNTQRNDMREQSYLDMLRQNKVDGAIVATHYLQTSDYKDLSLPLVQWMYSLMSQFLLFKQFICKYRMSHPGGGFNVRVSTNLKDTVRIAVYKRSGS